VNEALIIIRKWHYYAIRNFSVWQNLIKKRSNILVIEMI